MLSNSMFDKKVQQLGNELGVSEKDLANIRRKRLRKTLLYALVGAIVLACSAGIGFLAGTASRDSGGYPYAAGLALATGAKKTRRGRVVLVTVLLAAVAAVAAGVAAYKAGQHSSFHFGGTPAYGAFSRQK